MFSSAVFKTFFFSNLPTLFCIQCFIVLESSEQLHGTSWLRGIPHWSRSARNRSVQALVTLEPQLSAPRFTAILFNRQSNNCTLLVHVYSLHFVHQPVQLSTLFSFSQKMAENRGLTVNSSAKICLSFLRCVEIT